MRALVALLLLLPRRAVLSLGAALGRVAFFVDRRDRRRAIDQLGWALDLPRAAAHHHARCVFENVGRVAAELAILPRLGPILDTFVELPDRDRRVLDDALALGRGVVFVSAHLGSFELLAQRIAHAGFDSTTLAKKASNPFLGEWLVARRLAGGVDTVNRGDPRAARKMLGVLRRGALLGVLIDQDTKVDSIHVPFFGRPASTPTVAAELALRSELPIVTGFIHRRPEGGHVITLERIEAPSADLPKEARVEALTATLTAKIEAAIRAHPDEWVWFHERWRR